MRAGMRLITVAALVLLAGGWTAASGDDEVIEAARRQDAVAVRALLDAGADVNRAQTDGATALHWAAYRADAGTAETLLAAGADPNALNQLGVTPLALACGNGDADMVRRLLEAGADAALTPPERPPVLLSCARTGNADAVAALIRAGADVNAREPIRGQTALMWAAAQRHAAVVEVLLNAGADVHARSRTRRRFVNIGDPNDHLNLYLGTIEEGAATPLLFAARQGDAASARLLLAAGADAHDAGADRISALLTAAHGGHRELTALLLADGADSNDGSAGYTALHAAALRGDREMAAALLAAGAGPDARVTRGTPATRGGSDFILPQTLAGATPLLLAAKFLEADIFELLLAHGADRQLTLDDGTTPLMTAAGVLSRPGLFDRRDRIAVVRAPDDDAALRMVRRLVDLGARVDAANVRGDTALHGAAVHDYHGVIRFLVENGARTAAANALGQTPRDVAGTPETAALLDTRRGAD